MLTSLFLFLMSSLSLRRKPSFLSFAIPLCHCYFFQGDHSGFCVMNLSFSPNVNTIHNFWLVLYVVLRKILMKKPCFWFVRSHERWNGLIQDWDFKPAWKQVLFTWRFISAAFQNEPIWMDMPRYLFWVVFTWYYITRNWISFLSKWPIWNPYRFEFHFVLIHVNTSKELTEHWTEIFNQSEIWYRFDFIFSLMWASSLKKSYTVF